MTTQLRPLDDASLDEAQAAFLAVVEPLAGVAMPLLDAQSHALAAEVLAPISLPPYDNSAMDGYALRAADVAGASSEEPVVLDIVGEASAGHAFRGKLAAGQVARIMTGAPLPTGADAVLPDEEATVHDRHLVVAAALFAGRHVRRAGEDVVAGSRVLAAGVALGPAGLALLAALGLAEARVVRRPRVAVLTTGDELRMPGERRGESGIYNANLFALYAQVREAGAVPVPLPPAGDDPHAIATALEVGLQADAVVTSAGMCTGRHDHVAAILSHRGRFVAGCLRLRPARHVGLGLIDRTPIFALPGNPAASLLAFELLVRPAILRMGGHISRRRPEIRATLTEPLPSVYGATQAVWACLKRDHTGYLAYPAGIQGAGVLGTAARADGLILVPEDVGCYAAGDIISVQLLTDAMLR